MTKPKEAIHPITIYIVIAGTLLAAVTSMAQLPNGAFRLSYSFLLLGITPYVMYASFSGILNSLTQIITGIALLAADLIARIGLCVIHTENADHNTAIYLCFILIMLVMPAGTIIGRMTSRLMNRD